MLTTHNRRFGFFMLSSKFLKYWLVFETVWVYDTPRNGLKRRRMEAREGKPSLAHEETVISH
jgi:hypothetical protein